MHEVHTMHAHMALLTNLCSLNIFQFIFPRATGKFSEAETAMTKFKNKLTKDKPGTHFEFNATMTRV